MKILTITAGVFLALYVSYRVFRVMSLDRGLDKLIENGAVILDVRTEKEFKRGHIEGALNISLGTIRERYTELDTSQTYITYCSHGLRSAKVESLLKERGFKKVYNGGAKEDLEAVIADVKK